MFIFEGSMLANLTDTNTLYRLRAQLPDQSIRSTSPKSIHDLAMGSSYHMACTLSKRNDNTTNDPQELISDALAVETISIYPNPASNQLSITAPAQYQKVELYDVVGNLVYDGNINKAIHTSHLSNGVYLVKLYATDNTTKTIKVIIQHD